MDDRDHAVHGDGTVNVAGAGLRLACIAAVVAVVAVVLSSCGGDASRRPATPADPPATEVTVEPDTTQARLAALSAVSLTGEVAGAGFASRSDLVESFTTPEFAPVLLDRTNEQLRALTAEFVDRGISLAEFTAIETPVTAEATFTPDGVRVSVWSVLVVVVADLGPARQTWRTVTVDLVQRSGRWLVDGWESAPGPTPVPATESTFDDAAAFEKPLSWAPASGGGEG